jgi:hypothetical protein
VEFPWTERDQPPAVSGVQLGDTEQQALNALGPPDDVSPTTNGEVLEYAARGLELTATPKGISAIRLRSPSAGDIGGIRVGSRAHEVIVQWGVPKSGENRTAIFGNGKWAVAVTLHEKYATVVELTLAWAAAANPLPQADINVFKTQ